MKKEIVSSPFDAIVTHKYLERKGKRFFLLTNIQKLDQLDCFMLLLDMGKDCVLMTMISIKDYYQSLRKCMQ